MDSMLSKALRDFMSGPLNQLVVNLAGEDGAAWEAELKRFNRKEPCWCSKAESPLGDTFRLTVDYGQSLEAMVAAGRYDWKNDDINAVRFPIKGEGTVEFEARYFHFDRNIFSENAVKEIEVEGWAPAQIEHLLVHGAASPEEQRKHPIIALGSVAGVGGSCSVPFLGRDGSRRSVHLDWWGSDWFPICRFLAVREIKS